MAESPRDQFNKAAQHTEIKQPTAPEQNREGLPLSTERPGSKMVQNSHPEPRVPPPPSVGHASDAQAYNRKLATEKAQANQQAARLNRTPPKPVVDSKYQEQGLRLREKFKKAAQQDKQQGR